VASPITNKQALMTIRPMQQYVYRCEFTGSAFRMNLDSTHLALAMNITTSHAITNTADTDPDTGLLLMFAMSEARLTTKNGRTRWNAQNTMSCLVTLESTTYLTILVLVTTWTQLRTGSDHFMSNFVTSTLTMTISAIKAAHM